MNTRTILFLSVAASLAAGSLGLAACSSSNTGTTPLPTPLDSGNNGDSASSGDTGNAHDTGTTTDAGSNDGETTADAACKAAVPLTHPADGGTGPYCPFLASDAGHCALGETCCHPSSSGAETCTAQGACTVPEGGLEFECEGPLQCGAGKVCCYRGAVKSQPGCPDLIYSHELGTRCATECTSGSELVACTQMSDCGDAGTCTPFASKGGHALAYCKP